MSERKRYRILILIKSLGLGGAERLIVDSLPYLDQDQFDYHFAYFLPWKDFLASQIEGMGFPVYCLGTVTDKHRQKNDRDSTDHALDREAATDDQQMRVESRRTTTNHPLASSGGGWTALRAVPTGLQQLVKLVQRDRFDLIHADMPLPGVFARLVGRWQGIPVIYTEHNLLERYHPLTHWASSLTYGWNKCVLAVSQEVSDSIARFGLEQKTQVFTLLNGIPVEQVRAEAGDLTGLREELGIPENHLVVGTVAVFRLQKRLQDWIEVAGRIAAQRQDVTFLLVGHGPEEAALKAKIQSMGLAKRIRMPGFRPDGRRLMGLMDVYLMTSEFEGLPIALLEALALGKPVVSTAVGGIPELVRPTMEGFLTSVGNIDNLVRFTLQLLNDPERRQQMGQQGAHRVETEFHLKRRTQFIENIYLRVLQEAQGNAIAIAGC